MKTAHWANQNANQLHVAGAKRGKIRAYISRLVLVLLLIGWESGASFVNQSQSEVKQDQSKRNLLSILKWKPLCREALLRAQTSNEYTLLYPFLLHGLLATLSDAWGQIVPSGCGQNNFVNDNLFDFLSTVNCIFWDTECTKFRYSNCGVQNYRRKVTAIRYTI